MADILMKRGSETERRGEEREREREKEHGRGKKKKTEREREKNKSRFIKSNPGNINQDDSQTLSLVLMKISHT